MVVVNEIFTVYCKFRVSLAICLLNRINKNVTYLRRNAVLKDSDDLNLAQIEHN